MMHNGYFFGMHGIWWIIWILFLVWMFFSSYPSSRRYKAQDESLDILRQRLARGEIDEQEFEQKKKTLFDRKEVG